ncbi:MAG: SDR family NAD(P)-dependent oxidoreductase [Saprospirales bacterium]|nr:SDR family NAD(P)-dependent oxidoreductase [Saprospirales bacterium]
MQHFHTHYGPWALVAGASEGLGAAYAEALAKRGLHLILIARRASKLDALAKVLKDNYPIEVKTYALDLSDKEEISRFLSQLDVDPGLLVYNAAYAPIGYFNDLSEDDLQKVVAVNVLGPLLLTKSLSQK